MFASKPSFWKVLPSHTSEHLLHLLMEASVHMCDEENPFGLIVIDSIMGIFRTDYQGRGELSERQQALGKVLQRFGFVVTKRYFVLTIAFSP